jgi:hypothetical protein
VAGFLVCALAGVLVYVTLGWHGVVGGLIGLALGSMLRGGGKRAERVR